MGSRRWTIVVEFENGRRKRYRKTSEKAVGKSIEQIVDDFVSGRLAPYWNGATISVEIEETTVRTGEQRVELVVEQIAKLA